jgi:hypothetical protein
VNENFVAWAGDIRYTDAYRVSLGAGLSSLCSVLGFGVHPVTCCTCVSRMSFDLLQLSNSLRATGYPFVGLLAFSGSRTRLVLAIQVHAQWSAGLDRCPTDRLAVQQQSLRASEVKVCCSSESIERLPARVRRDHWGLQRWCRHCQPLQKRTAQSLLQTAQTRMLG